VGGLVAAIQPIKGQIGWTDAVLTDRVLRGPAGYVAPGGGGTLIGATMAAGVRDREVDPAAAERLLAMAEALSGQAVPGRVDWRVGVRGATADGLPLAGAMGDGLHVALAPRRNGWLLGPRVAGVVAEGIEDGAQDPAFDPRRLMLPAG
jgi:glycine oxidase